MLDQETIWQVTVAVGAVLVFLAVSVVVSSVYSSNGNISVTGGFALVGAIVVFILVMSVAGLWLERQDFEDESEG